MRHTNFSGGQTDKIQMITHYLTLKIMVKWKKIPFRNIDTVGAAGCINSTIEDMTKWVLLHLNEGKTENHDLISTELLQEMYTPHTPIPDEANVINE